MPAAAIADAAYVGSVTDTSNLANILTISIRERHPYLPEELTRSALQRIIDTHHLGDTFSGTASGYAILEVFDKRNGFYARQFIRRHGTLSLPLYRNETISQKLTFSHVERRNLATGYEQLRTQNLNQLYLVHYGKQ